MRVQPLLALLLGILTAALGGHLLGLVPWLHSLLEVRAREAGSTTSDVMVVLGYALFRSGQPTEPLKGRVEAAVRAYQEGRAQYVILSGAHPGEGLRGESEANVMYRYAASLMGQDLDPQRWLKEEASTSTRENAVLSLQMVKARGWGSVVLVTSPFHQRRSLWTFMRAAKDLQMQPGLQLSVARSPFVGHQGYGGPLLDTAVDLWDWVREVLAIVYYFAKGYL